MLADFESAVIGMSPGESKSFDMTFPSEYFSKELAGQTVTFEITVKEVGEPVLPEVDADFAKGPWAWKMATWSRCGPKSRAISSAR
jgi:trigger factor